MKRLGAIIALTLIFAMLCPLFISADDGAPDTSAAAVSYLYCFNTDKVLYEKNTGTSIAPGSSTKMMTALIALENIDDFSKKIAITSELLRGNQGGGAGFKAGMSTTLSDLFSALVCAGSNDAATIIANYVAGDVQSFVEMMNKRASELLMTHTYYSNPTGVDEASARTTAGDIALLAFELYTNGQFMDAAKAPSHMIDCLGKRVYNRNYFRTTWYSTKYYNTSVNGMNAGVTDASGYCVVATADISGNSYLCIVLGGSDDGVDIHSYTVARDLLSWASKSFAYKEVFSSAKIFCTLPVKYGNETDSVIILPKRASNVYLPKNASIENEVTVSWGLSKDYLVAPITEGSVIGKADVYYNGELVDSVELIVGASVARSKTSYTLTLVRNFFTSRYLWEALVGIALIALVILIYRLYKIKGADIFIIKRKTVNEDSDSEEEDVIDLDDEDELYENKEKKGLSALLDKIRNRNKRGE